MLGSLVGCTSRNIGLDGCSAATTVAEEADLARVWVVILHDPSGSTGGIAERATIGDSGPDEHEHERHGWE